MTRSKYFCSDCQRGFKDKCDLGRHLNRKTPCTAAQITSTNAGNSREHKAEIRMNDNPLFEESLSDEEADNVTGFTKWKRLPAQSYILHSDDAQS